MTPRGPQTTSGDVWGCHNWGGRARRPVSGGDSPQCQWCLAEPLYPPATDPATLALGARQGRPRGWPSLRGCDRRLMGSRGRGRPSGIAPDWTLAQPGTCFLAAGRPAPSWVNDKEVTEQVPGGASQACARKSWRVTDVHGSRERRALLRGANVRKDSAGNDTRNGGKQESSAERRAGGASWRCRQTGPSPRGVTAVTQSLHAECRGGTQIRDSERLRPNDAPEGTSVPSQFAPGPL